MDSIDRAAIAASEARSRAFARQWHRNPAVAALAERFDGLARDDAAAVADRVETLFESDHWVSALVEPMLATLRVDPWFAPPLRVSRDALKIAAVLFDDPLVTITASVVSADALALLPPPGSVVVPGRLTMVRYIRSGNARLTMWRAPPIDDGFRADRAVPAVPLGTIPLGDGVVLQLDGRRRGWWLAGATADVVTLTAVIRAEAAPLMREYALPSGTFLRCATLDEGAAQAQMLLALLRHCGRRDAAPSFAVTSRDHAPFVRWAAMREWLALDALAALPRLREMTDDANAEVRSAAAATLALVERRLAERSCRT
jgi:hypothetical protein